MTSIQKISKVFQLGKKTRLRSTGLELGSLIGSLGLIKKHTKVQGRGMNTSPYRKHISQAAERSRADGGRRKCLECLGKSVFSELHLSFASLFSPQSFS